MSTRILALVGSVRAASTNRQLAEAARDVAPEHIEVLTFDGLAELPFYNEDHDNDAERPEAANRLRAAAKDADALLLITPEYNGTIPAVLKNAIDWLSRPFGAGALKGKPAAVIGTSMGQYGGAWAIADAHKSLKIAGASVVEDIDLKIPGSVRRFAEVHPREDTEIAQQLRTALEDLAEFSSAALV